MFSSLRTSPLAQRAFGALDLARSFLMLEDDYDIDWEVDRDEPSSPVHLHRAPLRRGAVRRRAGQPAPAANVCISPTFYGQPTRRIAAATRGSMHSARRGSYPEARGRAGRTGMRAGSPRPPGCDRHARLS